MQVLVLLSYIRAESGGIIPSPKSRGPIPCPPPLLRRLCLHLQTQFGEDEDRCTQFRVIVVKDPQTQTDRTDYNTLRR